MDLLDRINRIFSEDRDQLATRSLGEGRWSEGRKSRGWGFGTWDLENHAETTVIRFN